MFERFRERARKVVVLAQEDTRRHRPGAVPGASLTGTFRR
jgi:hypothetical protein